MRLGEDDAGAGSRASRSIAATVEGSAMRGWDCKMDSEYEPRPIIYGSYVKHDGFH